MKKRMLATLLALSLVLTLGIGALAAEEELNDYQLTGSEMAALSEALGGADSSAVNDAFFHIVMTYEQTSKSQAFTYADAIADVLAADGDSNADALASMFGIGYEEELEVVTAISDWLAEQQMDEERTAGFFQSLSDGMNWPTDAYKAFAEELFPAEDAADGSAEPIEFDIDPANTDETGAVLGTAAVPADGRYLFSVSLSPMDEAADVTFTSDLPIQTDSAVVPVDELANGLQYIYAVVELTAGDYTVAVGNAYYSADLIPVQMVDSLEGTFEPDSVYVCALDEPVTVTYTVDSMLYTRFYGGAEGGLLQDLAQDSETSAEVTVEFPAGTAVIDASDGIFPITGTMS